MSERKGLVTFMGNPLTLIGNEVKVGESAPDFVVLDNNLSPVKLSSFRGKVCILSSVPSLDTPVCDTETRKFNEAAGRLGNDIAILTISIDLPFAQKRWCAAAGVNQVQTLSNMVARMDATPGVKLAIESAGMSTREYIVFSLSMMQNGMAGWVVSQPGAELPPDVSMANVEFYQAHEAQIQQVGAGMKSGDCDDEGENSDAEEEWSDSDG